MTDTLLPTIPTCEPLGLALLEDLAEEAYRFAAASKSPVTIRGYRSDWRIYAAWCDQRGLVALPAAPETVTLYVTDMAGRCKVATIQRHLAAIAQAHVAQGLEPPTREKLVRTTMAGIRRTLGTAQVGKTPVLTADLRAVTATFGADLADVRDRALLLIGFAGAFRRSELVALDVTDVSDGADGLTVLLRRSKTDQEGRGRKVGLPYGSDPSTCPVRAYRAWLAASGIVDGRVFRPVRAGQVVGDGLAGRAVARVVKRRLSAAGIDPTSYSGHSLRAGLATAAAQAGASERSIMAQTGHKSLPMVRRYIRDGNLFRQNAAGMVGL